MLCAKFLSSKNFSVFSNTRNAFFTQLNMIVLIQHISLDDKTVCINAGSLCSVLLEYDFWKLQPNNGGLKSRGQISVWSMLMISIYWEKT